MEGEGTSSSGSRDRLRERATLPRFAADMLERSGELFGVREGGT